MLEQFLTELCNWFRVRDSVDGKHPGTYTIENGGIALPFLRDGQYFRIMGSLFSDGLHCYGPEMEILEDETFTGTIWALAIPKIVIDTAKEKAEVEAKIADVTGSFASSGFTSESFGGYSYSKDTTGQLSALNSQRDEIVKRMNQWRKLRED